jgi:hypothetical protein
MDGSTFDTITRLASRVNTRRTALRTVIGGSVASAAAAVGLAETTSNAEAKKKKKCKKKCPVCSPLVGNVICTSNLQCCTNETNRACLVPFGSGNSDRMCCGATGATCASPTDCCQNFSCTGGTCQPVFSV